jgi:hypothetical protein
MAAVKMLSVSVDTSACADVASTAMTALEANMLNLQVLSKYGMDANKDVLQISSFRNKAMKQVPVCGSTYVVDMTDFEYIVYDEVTHVSPTPLSCVNMDVVQESVLSEQGDYGYSTFWHHVHEDIMDLMRIVDAVPDLKIYKLYIISSSDVAKNEGSREMMSLRGNIQKMLVKLLAKDVKIAFQVGGSTKSGNLNSIMSLDPRVNVFKMADRTLDCFKQQGQKLVEWFKE